MVQGPLLIGITTVGHTVAVRACSNDAEAAAVYSQMEKMSGSGFGPAQVSKRPNGELSVREGAENFSDGRHGINILARLSYQHKSVIFLMSTINSNISQDKPIFERVYGSVRWI
jgi:hypothetical protein